MLTQGAGVGPGAGVGAGADTGVAAGVLGFGVVLSGVEVGDVELVFDAAAELAACGCAFSI